MRKLVRNIKIIEEYSFFKNMTEKSVFENEKQKEEYKELTINQEVKYEKLDKK